MIATATVPALTLALALCPCQEPQSPPQMKSPDRDVVQLKVGERITGVIIKETEDYVEIQMGPGTIVGLQRSRIESIQRRVREPELPDKAVLDSRDEWFLLHDGEGKTVGHVHCTVTPTDDGDLRIGEEWSFKDKKGVTDITILEVVDGSLAPKSCFYHERSMARQDGRLLSERLVDGKILDEQFVVTIQSFRGREKRSYRFEEGTKFPLSYLEELRQSREGAPLEAVQLLFDPKSEDFVRCKVTVRKHRKVSLRGRTTEVREIITEAKGVSNLEWLNGSCRVVHREVNGPALVAVPVAEDQAKRALSDHKPTFTFKRAVVSDRAGRLALWLPNPTWHPVEAQEGEVRIESSLYGASATLMELDQLSPELALDSAADSILRWLRLSVGRELKLLDRQDVEVRGQPAVRLETSYSVLSLGGSRPFRAHLLVFSSNERYFSLYCSAPRDEYKHLQVEFRRILQSVQLRAQEVTPVLQGPLREKNKKMRRRGN